MGRVSTVRKRSVKSRTNGGNMNVADRDGATGAADLTPRSVAAHVTAIIPSSSAYDGLHDVSGRPMVGAHTTPSITSAASSAYEPNR
ncbi:MAG: hypothetical protein AVDCRST_MAG93-7768 [uncultured Chloroflexia bacterium]|uniref:Uncharacterized protein n=1 Tax=uncultured Chloroflexia bacterium TaxID=1672391 RepID=A0A6J4MLS4_9CHLR|nr:MAG: hypothetical protein AVDCRST_MAG93-7768 [uncultured Chloroflexia bacterium]